MSNDFTNEDFASMLSEMENEAKKGSFVSPYWKPENEGVSKIRVLTPLKAFSEKLFYQKHMMHYVNNRAYFCLNQTLKDKNGELHEAEQCPLCQKASQIYRVSQRGTEDWNIAGSLRAKERFVSRVIVRGKKDPDGTDTEAKPVFWEFGKKIHDTFFNAISTGEYGNFLSLKEGRDYNLVKKGTGRNTDYSGSALSVNTSPVFTDVEKIKVLQAELPKMEYSQLVEFKTKQEMQAALDEMFNGTVDTPVAPAPAVDTLNPFEQPATSVNPVAPAPAAETPTDIDQLLDMI